MKRATVLTLILVSWVSLVSFFGVALLIAVVFPTHTTNNLLNPPTRDQLYQYALKIVNEDRRTHGVPPVLLGNDYSAQAHADDMLNTKYYSHWNTEGVKPYVTYTKLGGRGYVSENIDHRYVTCSWATCSTYFWDPFKVINQSEYRMMYNDSLSNWGHRDNIIDPDHTNVSFGVAYDTENIYFIEHFENNIINWQTMTLRGTQLHLVGQMPPGFTLGSISVYEDPDPRPLTGHELDNAVPYHHNPPHYDLGQAVGLILVQPTKGYYTECSPGKITWIFKIGEKICLDYTTYRNVSSTPGGIDIAVDVSKWMGPGLHTIYVFLKKPNGDYAVATSVTLEYLR